MDFAKFLAYTREYNLIPVHETIAADLLTPVSAYLKVRKTDTPGFLLESVEGTLNLARYSFIGVEPERIIMNRGREITEITPQGTSTIEGDVFGHIESILQSYHQPAIAELPSLSGGLVGFIGYENMSLIEPTVPRKYNSGFAYDSILGLYKTLLAFDHYRHQLIIIVNVSVTADTNPEQAYLDAKAQIKAIKKDLRQQPLHIRDFTVTGDKQPSFPMEKFSSDIAAAKQHILEGDIFQIVLSRRFSTTFDGDLIQVYRALRIINPSPYMYFMEFANDTVVIGTSPENLLKVQGGVAELLPIAGTRKRGSTEEHDKRLEAELLADPKELAEHTMLVDLGRNDLGRVCGYDSVHVVEQMQIHRYSHVMHIVSRVEGKLNAESSVYDALKACFPAGTVTGAPKIRAMQLIDAMEDTERNIYAGAAGYFDFKGNMDMCIAIRTFFAKGKTLYWQAGAGIVADSKAELEALEIRNKAAVLVKALEFAEVIDENSGN
ncbi:MAG: chorismate-binding protein [Ignavibacteriales bacterium]|nr:chorismate-binding protein [Ignavibacteriales bacterium]